MPGLTYVYMPSIPGWVSPNRPEPEPKKEERPAGNARPKKTAEYWFKFYMGELEEKDYILDTWEPEPTPARTPVTASEADEEEDDDEDLIVSWPMTPEEIDAWQNQPISELPPYYGASKESHEPQSAPGTREAGGDFAAEGLGGAALAASPPTPRTAHYHWPFPSRDTVSLNLAPTPTTTLNVPGTTSPRRITLRRYVTTTQPAGSIRTSAFCLHPSAFSGEERPPPRSQNRVSAASRRFRVRSSRSIPCPSKAIFRLPPSYFCERHRTLTIR